MGIEFASGSTNKNFFLGVFYGGGISLALYNFFIFLSIREKSHFYYVLFQLTNLFALASLSGISFRFFWPEIPQINNEFIPLFIIIALSSAIVFSIRFLETKITFPLLNKLLIFLLVIFIGTSSFIWKLDYAYQIYITVAFILATALALFFLGLFSYIYTNNRVAKYYLLSWFSLLIGTSLTALKNIGVLPINFLTDWGMHIGAFMEYLLISFALADRINILRAEQLRLQNEATEYANQLNEILQNSRRELVEKVAERTFELQVANDQLQKIISSKNLLLKEVYHRVKNNIQIVIAMMWLKKKDSKHIALNMFIDDSIMRLTSIGKVHELLYQSDDLANVSMYTYFDQLVNLLLQNHENEVIVTRDFSDFYLDMEQAIIIGLITNEILNNILKHAFALHDLNSPRKIYISARKHEKKIYIRIKDNGIGFSFKNSKFQDSLGIMLVEDFTEKLPHGRCIFKKWKGTYFKLEFEHES